MSSFEEAVVEMFGGLFADGTGQPETVVHVGEHEVPLGKFLSLLAEASQEREAQQQYAPPARGSEDYREAIATVALLENQRMVTSSLYGLWEDFGWRGPLDLMVEWIIQMETSPNLVRRCRDICGVVDIGEIVVITGDTEHTLRAAADQAQEAIEAKPDAKPHEELAKALKMGEHTAELGALWLPVIRKAFAAAKQNPADRRAVFAELFHGPNRTVKYDLIQVGIIIGTAAMGVRNLHELARRFHAQGARAVVDRKGAINPAWSTSYRSRSAD